MRIPKLLQIAALILLAAGAQPAYTAVYQWSKTSSSNATADPTINWAEGMSPSSVNDSARAMMARLSEYRDDISGLLATGGTSVAYTVTTNQGLCQAPDSTTTPKDGQLLSVTVNTSNGSSPTLLADGCNAFPIQSSPAVSVAPSSLIQGSPYSMKFSTANSAWMLKGFYASQTNVPLGAGMDYWLPTAPSSVFVFAFGQAISRTTYAALFAVMGTTFGAGDGVTTFNLPDKRGRVSATPDIMGGPDANRLVQSPSMAPIRNSVGGAGGLGAVSLSVSNLPPYTPSGSVSNGAISIGNVSNIPTSGFFTGNNNGGGGGAFGVVNGGPAAPTASQGASSFSGSAQGGSNTLIENVQPTILCNYIIRVL